jgi:hypothetical protein
MFGGGTINGRKQQQHASMEVIKATKDRRRMADSGVR